MKICKHVITKLLVIIALLLAVDGCAKKVSAPLPGSINSFDSLTYQTLMDAQAAIGAVKLDVDQGKFVPSPAQKAVINHAIADYDIAEAAWHVYHSGATADTAGLTQAVDALVADIAALATQISAGGK